MGEPRQLIPSEQADPSQAPRLYANVIRAAYGPQDITIHLFILDGVDLSEELKRASGSAGHIDAAVYRVASVQLPVGAAEVLRDSLSEVLEKQSRQSIFREPDDG